MKRNYSVVLILSAIAVALCLIYWGQKSQVAQSDQIVIGVASGYMPWATRNDHGELEGFDVEIAQELAQRLNLPLTLVDMSPEMLMASVRAKKIDCMVAPMAITPEREKAYHMIHYQGSATDQWPLMMRSDSACVMSSLEDCIEQNVSVGALSGTKQSEYALSIKGLDVHVYDSMPHILMGLRTHKIACALIDPDLGKQLIAENKDMRVILLSIPPVYQSRGNGIAVHLDNAALAHHIHDAIATMKQDGFIEHNEHKWQIGRLT